MSSRIIGLIYNIPCSPKLCPAPFAVALWGRHYYYPNSSQTFACLMETGSKNLKHPPHNVPCTWYGTDPFPPNSWSSPTVPCGTHGQELAVLYHLLLWGIPFPHSIKTLTLLFPCHPLNLMSSDIIRFPSMLTALLLPFPAHFPLTPEDLSLYLTDTLKLGLFWHRWPFLNSSLSSLNF